MDKEAGKEPEVRSSAGNADSADEPVVDLSNAFFGATELSNASGGAD